jgi:multidrug efflux pump subunit AcrB
VDRDRAARVGLTQSDIAGTLLTTLSSSALVSPSFWLSPENSINYLVAVQTPLLKMESTDDLMATPIAATTPLLQASSAPGTDSTSHPTAAYLGSVADLTPATDMALVNHVTVQRVIDVQCSAEGRALGGVARDIQRAIDELRAAPVAAGGAPLIPAPARVRIRGQSEAMFDSFRNLGLGLILAVVLVYLLLVTLFQSWMDPFIIIFAVPGALVGILWMLALTGTTLNVESLMGSIMAVGIAVSNSILLVSFANEVRVDRGMGPLAAALEAGKTRLRPVLMTALAMIIGMAPMALSLGEGGEQNAPLGRAVIGGLLVATVVTLFVVPVIYSLLRRAPPRAHELDVRFEAEAAGVGSHGHPEAKA